MKAYNILKSNTCFAFLIKSLPKKALDISRVYFERIISGLHVHVFSYKFNE